MGGVEEPQRLRIEGFAPLLPVIRSSLRAMGRKFKCYVSLNRDRSIIA
jgi:hypothetical protein